MWAGTSQGEPGGARGEAPWGAGQGSKQPLSPPQGDTGRRCAQRRPPQSQRARPHFKPVTELSSAEEVLATAGCRHPSLASRELPISGGAQAHARGCAWNPWGQQPLTEVPSGPSPHCCGSSSRGPQHPTLPVAPTASPWRGIGVKQGPRVVGAAESRGAVQQTGVEEQARANGSQTPALALTDVALGRCLLGNGGHPGAAPAAHARRGAALEGPLQLPGPFLLPPQSPRSPSSSLPRPGCDFSNASLSLRHSQCRLPHLPSPAPVLAAPCLGPLSGSKPPRPCQRTPV